MTCNNYLGIAADVCIKNPDAVTSSLFHCERTLQNSVYEYANTECTGSGSAATTDLDFECATKSTCLPTEYATFAQYDSMANCLARDTGLVQTYPVVIGECVTGVLSGDEFKVNCDTGTATFTKCDGSAASFTLCDANAYDIQCPDPAFSVIPEPLEWSAVSAVMDDVTSESGGWDSSHSEYTFTAKYLAVPGESFLNGFGESNDIFLQTVTYARWYVITNLNDGSSTDVAFPTATSETTSSTVDVYSSHTEETVSITVSLATLNTNGALTISDVDADTYNVGFNIGFKMTATAADNNGQNVEFEQDLGVLTVDTTIDREIVDNLAAGLVVDSYEVSGRYVYFVNDKQLKLKLDFYAPSGAVDISETTADVFEVTIATQIFALTAESVDCSGITVQNSDGLCKYKFSLDVAGECVAGVLSKDADSMTFGFTSAADADLSQSLPVEVDGFETTCSNLAADMEHSVSSAFDKAEYSPDDTVKVTYTMGSLAGASDQGLLGSTIIASSVCNSDLANPEALCDPADSETVILLDSFGATQKDFAQTVASGHVIGCTFKTFAVPSGQQTLQSTILISTVGGPSRRRVLLSEKLAIQQSVEKVDTFKVTEDDLTDNAAVIGKTISFVVAAFLIFNIH